jgi:hypothetical protein
MTPKNPIISVPEAVMIAPAIATNNSGRVPAEGHPGAASPISTGSYGLSTVSAPIVPGRQRPIASEETHPLKWNEDIMQRYAKRVEDMRHLSTISGMTESTIYPDDSVSMVGVRPSNPRQMVIVPPASDISLKQASERTTIFAPRRDEVSIVVEEEFEN